MKETRISSNCVSLNQFEMIHAGLTIANSNFKLFKQSAKNQKSQIETNDTLFYFT